MSDASPALSFRGGPSASSLPLICFLAVTVTLVSMGAPTTEGMILAAMLGISLGMLLARNVAEYSEAVFSLMANRIATVAVVCWLWAGAFSGILADSGLVEAIVWVGWKLQLTGALFALAVFVSSAFFAVSVGTGLGTIVGFTAVMYPAGIVLGAQPAVLMGAIFSGAALGDNLAPISDTTIVSAATQETDVGGVVRSRLKYVLIAAGISAVLFLALGGGGATLDAADAERLMTETADPTGLPMLIPGVIVFVVAISGGHFLAALTAGVATALLIGPLSGAFPLSAAFHVTTDGTVAGSALDGAIALIPTAILTLLLVTAIGIMQAGGFLTVLMNWLDRTIAKGVRGAEAAIVALVTVATISVSVNTVAMITTGPLVNELRKRHGIHAYRAANLMDTVACSFVGYTLPYMATTLAAIGIQRSLQDSYPFVPVTEWWQIMAYTFYGLVLFPLIIVAVITGYGRKAG